MGGRAGKKSSSKKSKIARKPASAPKKKLKKAQIPPRKTALRARPVKTLKAEKQARGQRKAEPAAREEIPKPAPAEIISIPREEPVQPARKEEAGATHKFVILKNYPESRHYEIVKKEPSVLDNMLEQLGLKKGNRG